MNIFPTKISVIRFMLRYGTYSFFLKKIFAAQLLGFRNYIPPYERTRGAALIRGVNYASGAAGIRDETGANLVYIESIIYYCCKW